MEDEWINPEHADLVAKYRAAQQVAVEREEDPRLRWFLQQSTAQQ